MNSVTPRVKYAIKCLKSKFEDPSPYTRIDRETTGKALTILARMGLWRNFTFLASHFKLHFGVMTASTLRMSHSSRPCVQNYFTMPLAQQLQILAKTLKAFESAHQIQWLPHSPMLPSSFFSPFFSFTAFWLQTLCFLHRQPLDLNRIWAFSV